MALRNRPSSDWVLYGLVVLLTAAVVALFLQVNGLRSDVEDLSGSRGGGPARSGSASPKGDDGALEQGLEDLRGCFNKALQNTFEDFYRYVFGGEAPPPPDRIVETCGALSTKAQAKLYKGNLDFPVDMAWDGDDTIYFTEKATGNIRVLRGRKLVSEPCASVEANSEGERGTLGIALDPTFDENGYLYVYYTNASPLENRVTRFTVEGDRCTDATDIVTGIEATSSTRHVGGQIEIVDDKMFVSVGDGYDDPSTAQDTSSPLGKINRYELDGTIPDDNPFGGDSPAWSYGHRNPFGLAQVPETGALYATENGPECDDELNLIVKGANYGWGPGYDCDGEGVGPKPRKALESWTPPVVPTDPWFYDGDTEALAGYLYVGEFGSGKLHQFELNESGDKVVGDEVIYDSPSQIVDVAEGPGGLLYFLTVDGIYRFEES